MGTNCAPLVDDLFLFCYDFDIVNFPFLAGDIPRSTSDGVYIFQIIRLARVSSHDDDFNTRNKIFKRLQQGYRYHKICKAFSNFYWRNFDLVSKYNVELIFLVRHPMAFIFLNLFVLLECLVKMMLLILVIKF